VVEGQGKVWGKAVVRPLTRNPHQPGKGSYPQATELPQGRGGDEIRRSVGGCAVEWSA
jgi:hypothetical protein